MLMTTTGWSYGKVHRLLLDAGTSMRSRGGKTLAISSENEKSPAPRPGGRRAGHRCVYAALAAAGVTGGAAETAAA